MRPTTILFFLACAGCLAQNNLVFNTPTYAPPKLALCESVPQAVTQTITQPWTVYNCSNIGVNSGYLKATGTGWCAGEGQYCYASSWPAPWFHPIQQPATNGRIWQIYINMGSVPNGGATKGGYFCAPASTTQVPTPPQDVAQPPVCSCTNPGDDGPDACSGSPIVIDTFGEGFHLTNVARGVPFRKHPSDPITRMSWTDPAYHNGWLARPNPDGSVTNLATNLFGNFSPQPPGKNPNGYRALAYWAAQSGCGVVDHLDAQNCPAVWQQLRVWTDSNQDGIAQPAELHTLPELGVERISLNYRESPRTDQYGNQFRYVAGIDDKVGPKDNRCYDVFLLTGAVAAP